MQDLAYYFAKPRKFIFNINFYCQLYRIVVSRLKSFLCNIAEQILICLRLCLSFYYWPMAVSDESFYQTIVTSTIMLLACLLLIGRANTNNSDRHLDLVGFGSSCLTDLTSCLNHMKNHLYKMEKPSKNQHQHYSSLSYWQQLSLTNASRSIDNSIHNKQLETNGHSSAETYLNGLNISTRETESNIDTLFFGQNNSSAFFTQETGCQYIETCDNGNNTLPCSVRGKNRIFKTMYMYQVVMMYMYSYRLLW